MIRRNVLIFHQAALGDFIITWPIALALARILAQSRIIYVTHSQKAALAEQVLRVESADAEAGWHHLYSESETVARLPERPAKLLEGANTVISFTAGLEDKLARGIKRVAPHARIISLDTKSSIGGGHIVESLIEQARSTWPPMAEAMAQMLRSVQSRGTGFALAPKDRIILHPGAGKEANRWPAQRFLELAKRFDGSKHRVRVLLGEVETECWPGSLISEFERVAEVHRPASLLDLLEQLASASLFIGNDSGPGHLAAIIGVPTVSLFGPSDPVRWRPIGPNVRLIHANPITEIDVGKVYTEASGLMGG